MIENWKTYLIPSKNKIEFVLSFFLLVIALFILPRFLEFVENRGGVVLDDPLLRIIPAIDLTLPIFIILYLALIIALITLIKEPVHFIFAIQLYALMIFLRISAMYIVPLDPPVGMIALSDPFVEFFSTGKTFTKDLFFSGHTASLIIFFLTAYSRKLKIFFLLSAVSVAVMLVVQHVHYTIDILSAIFFTVSLYCILKLIKKSN